MRWALILLLFLLPAAASAQGLTPLQKCEVVEQAANAYAEGYVFEDKGRAIAAALRGRLKSGAYDSAVTAKQFAAALTATIQEVNRDRHIEIIPPAPRANATASPPPSRAERLGWTERLRRRNYDFVRVERLAGNVGYLRLDSFPPPELAAPTATAAMAFLENSDALIIDLRENGGGTGDMVRLLASYFFVEPTRLSRTFRRNRTPQVSYDMTLTQLPGKRMPIVDVFVLTSSKTISAAEAFAFALQKQERATIVGEISAGAGNAGDYVDIGHGFQAFVPDVHVGSPVDDTSWEGVGVKPDLPVAAANALATAHREAVRRLLAAATDERTREALRKALDLTTRP